MCSKKCPFLESPKLPFQFLSEIMSVFVYHRDRQKRIEMNERKIISHSFFIGKNICDDNFKNAWFFVLKVSGANSVLDIYRIQPVHNWIGNRDEWFSSSISSYFRYDISSEYFRLKSEISNRIFSAEHRVFKSFIFGRA